MPIRGKYGVPQLNTQGPNLLGALNTRNATRRTNLAEQQAPIQNELARGNLALRQKEFGLNEQQFETAKTFKALSVATGLAAQGQPEQAAEWYKQTIGEDIGFEMKGPQSGVRVGPYFIKGDLAEIAKLADAAAENPDISPQEIFAFGAQRGLQVVPYETVVKPTKGETSTKLNKLISEKNALDKDSPAHSFYDQAIKKEVTRSGETIRMNADGSVEIVRGGGGESPDLQKKTITDIETKQLSGREQLARMEKIASEFKPEFQEIGTRLANAWTGIKAKLGRGVSDDDERSLVEFKKFQRKAIENINLYIKELTGAQMSEKEANRLRLAQPDPGENWWKGDDPITFKSKMDDVLKTVRASIARYDYYKSKNLGDAEISAIINGDKGISLESLTSSMK